MSEIEQDSSWKEWGKHVLSEIDRLSAAITELVSVIGTLNIQVNLHESWQTEYEKNQSILQKMVTDQGNEINSLNKAKYILYGIVITISVLIGSGLVVYFLQR